MLNSTASSELMIPALGSCDWVKLDCGGLVNLEPYKEVLLIETRSKDPWAPPYDTFRLLLSRPHTPVGGAKMASIVIVNNWLINVVYEDKTRVEYMILRD